MSNIYMYPKLNKRTLESPNPYIDNLEASLNSKYTIINKTPNNKGVLDLYLFLFKTDAFFFNWIEDLPLKKLGKVQSILLILFLILSKILHKKILWVLHNKYSHNSNKSNWTKFIFELMIKKSNLIITHSNDGVKFIADKFPKHINKVKYVIHPVDKIYPLDPKLNIEYDLLIWGTIHPYKGVIEFLEYVKQSSITNDLKILILGYCPDQKLKRDLDNYLSEKIVHHNKFYDYPEIAEFANRSRFVLFTYNSDSVLSSGSLMDSICMGSSIIGPNKGAFKDLKSNSFINIYDSYEEIIKTINKSEKSTNSFHLDIENFCNDNNWDKFILKIDKDLDAIFRQHS